MFPTRPARFASVLFFLIATAHAGLASELTILSDPGHDVTYPDAINDSGEIVGYTVDAGHYGGFYYVNGKFTDFIVPGATYTVPTGINDHGEIVGFYSTPTSGFGFIYQNGSFTTVSYPGATSTLIWGVNILGQLVGSESSNASLPEQAFFESGGVFQIKNVPGAFETAPYGVNDHQVISGTISDINGYNSGFILGNTLTVLNVPGAKQTYVSGINDSGVVVGEYSLPDAFPTYAFEYVDGDYVPLDLPAAFYQDPVGINNEGYIVGNIYGANGNGYQGFLLAPVPEPRALMLAMIGLLGCAIGMKVKSRSKNSL